jgi:hypothetical protein
MKGKTPVVPGREARLRGEYASWYPSITVATWIPAATVARKVARQLVYGVPRWAPRWKVSGRVLDERHFLFRGDAAGENRAMQRRRPLSAPLVEEVEESQHVPLPSFSLESPGDRGSPTVG